MHLCSLPLCQFLSISVSLTLSFAQKCFHEPFQSILHTSWPLTPTYLGMYFQEYRSFLCSHSSLFCPLIRLCKYPQVSSVQSLSCVSDSLQPHESQHARPPCPSATPRVYSNSCPSSQWCHPAISSSVVPFSSCPQSLQHQGLFQWVNSLHEVAKVLALQLQHQSFQWTTKPDLL